MKWKGFCFKLNILIKYDNLKNYKNNIKIYRKLNNTKHLNFKIKRRIPN